MKRIPKELKGLIAIALLIIAVGVYEAIDSYKQSQKIAEKERMDSLIAFEEIQRVALRKMYEELPDSMRHVRVSAIGSGGSGGSGISLIGGGGGSGGHIYDSTHQGGKGIIIREDGIVYR